MVNVYYDKDADLAVLADKTIGILGYGSQGHAHALNLKDNGQKVVVGLYPGSRSRAVAEQAGLEVADVPEVAQRADVLMILIPDHIQGGVYREQVLPNLRPGSALMVAHGFSIHYREVVPPGQCGRNDGGAQSSRPSNAGAIPGRHRRAQPFGRPPGRNRPRQGDRPGLRQGHRLHRRRSFGDHLQG